MQDIVDMVNRVIANVLGIDAKDISERASLIDFYGAESLDFLDISFQLNKLFKIRLFRGDFLRKAAEYFGDSIPLVEDGVLTQDGVDLLKARMPELNGNTLLVAGAQRSVISRLYCSESWVRGVKELLEKPHMTGEQYTEEWLTQYKERTLSHQ